MLRPEYPIRTERLTLRPFTAGDFDDLHAMTGDPEVVRYLYWEVHTPQETRAALDRRIAQSELTEEGQWLTLAIVPDGVPRVVGQVVLKWASIKHQQGELGFTLNPEFYGRGYAREAAEAMLRLGFEGLGLHRIYAACDTRNSASWGLLTRLGLRREAHFVEDELFKGEFGDQYIYAMLDREWRALQSTSST
ncbi:GNAT family N-acetyltransferase [Dactylosporangium matsuzakiense]|uniref:N-acetyltransferase n=1 Tax=Dactylosporangium matsuzakiense TaxID=53360 RepID=A0A9W6KNP7_9ACTN|nr:GNAT family protein [Dactylosporangium matsuzakiense]UWZ42917.1 GNAT family N-acetyltransferase [Dactylosporangium matsuzakiense]GLL03949.1 N-acetyltransferase [Dactylosporangium matsuzakiense]